jgi:predicted nuclease with TOPRIM domain
MDQEMNNMVTFAIIVTGYAYLAYHTLGWCRDPLSMKLQAKVNELEEENDYLLDETSELKEERDALRKKLDDLKNVLV